MVKRSIFFILLLSCTLWAHKVNLFITNEQNSVHIYSYFANAAPCQKCQLLIKHNGETVLDTHFDVNGKYTYDSKYKTLDVTVMATGGHQAKQSVVVTNLSHDTLQAHQKKEGEHNLFKIIVALILMGIVFAVLKRVKR